MAMKKEIVCYNYKEKSDLSGTLSNGRTVGEVVTSFCHGVCFSRRNLFLKTIRNKIISINSEIFIGSKFV